MVARVVPQIEPQLFENVAGESGTVKRVRTLAATTVWLAHVSGGLENDGVGQGYRFRQCVVGDGELGAVYSMGPPRRTLLPFLLCRHTWQNEGYTYKE